jgi:hypothetical protein
MSNLRSSLAIVKRPGYIQPDRVTDTSRVSQCQWHMKKRLLEQLRVFKKKMFEKRKK